MKRKREERQTPYKNKKMKWGIITNKRLHAEYSLLDRDLNQKYAHLLDNTSRFYIFPRSCDIGFCLRSNERIILLGNDLQNGKRNFWVCIDLATVHKLMTRQKFVFYNEVITKNTPIKMFLDIEYELDPKIDKMSYLRNLCFSYIKRFKEEYLGVLNDHIQEINEKWLLLDSSNDKKLSFHLIGNHCLDTGQPIYYKDVEHMMQMVGIVLNLMRNTLFRNFVDLNFCVGKSLRTYFSSKRNDKERRMFDPNNTTYNPVTMEASLLQNYFPQRPYLELEFPPQLFRKANYIKKGGGVSRVLKTDTVLHNQFVLEFLSHLKNDLKFFYCPYKRMGFGFSFLKPQNYSVQKTSIYNGSVWLDLDSSKMECHIQDYNHSCRSGRRIALASDNKVILWCGGGKDNQKHIKTLIIRITGSKLVSIYSQIRSEI